jgi:uncharacterized protein (TIRG00374 family)
MLVGVLVFALVYSGFAVYSGLGAIAGRLAEFQWLAFAAACGLALCNFLIRFIKWEYYLRLLDVRGVGKLDSLLIFFSGFTLTITPGKVGEVFKSLLLRESHGVPIPLTAPVIVAERLTDVIGVVVLIVVGSLGFSGGLLWAAAGAIAVGFCLAAIMSKTLAVRLITLFGRLPGRIGAAAPRIREAWESLRILTGPRTLTVPALLSVTAWAMEGIALWVIVQGMGKGFGLPIGYSVFFYATATLAGGLVPIPGITEGSMEEQLRIVGGLPKDASTVAMILVRFATLWFAVLLGFVALAVFRRRHPFKN